MQAIVQVDSETGDYYIVIPDNILKEMNWDTNTNLVWEYDGKDLILRELKEDE
jgi:hypothetical protein